MRINIKLEQRYINNDKATTIGISTFVALWAVVIAFSVPFAFAMWSSDVHDAKHNKYWHISKATVVSYGWVKTDPDTQKKQYTLSYNDWKNHDRIAYRKLSKPVNSFQEIPVDVNNEGRLWIPSQGDHQWRGSPFIAHHDMYPTGFIVLAIIFGGFITIGIGLLTTEGLDCKYRKVPIVSIIRAPTEWVLVHNKNGELVEKEKKIRRWKS